MNKRILVLSLVVIIVTVAIALYLVTSATKISIIYSSKYGNTFYSGNNTYILFYLNVTTNRDCQFDFGRLQLTCNGQPVAPIATENTGMISLQSNLNNSVQLDYQVKGKVTGNFQSVYKGPMDVTLNGSPSVAVRN
jgi:hypothetical protein